MEPFVIGLSHEEEELRKIVEPLLDSEGFELVRLSLKRAQTKSHLGVFVDTKERQNGIVMGNLEFISRLLSDVLDAAVEEGSILRGSYELEVSSPGLNRPLTKVPHFAAAVAQRIKMKLINPDESGVKTFYGRVVSSNENGLVLETEGKVGSREISYNDIAEAHIVFDFAKKTRN